MANRVTQLAVDIAVTGAAAARLSWLSVEALVSPPADVRLSWLSVEVLAGNDTHTCTVTADYLLAYARSVTLDSAALLQLTSTKQVTADALLAVFQKTVSTGAVLYKSYRVVSGSAYLIPRTYSKTLTATGMISGVLGVQVFSSAVLGAKVGGSSRTVLVTASLLKPTSKTVTTTAVLYNLAQASLTVTGDAVLVKSAHTLLVQATAELYQTTTTPQSNLSQFFGRRL